MTRPHFFALLFTAAIGVAACDSSTGNAVTPDSGIDAPDAKAPPPDVARDVAPDLQCPMGQTACGARCSALTDDPDNCGACGAVCPRTQVCASGTCRISCPSGQSLCDGRCVTTDTDRAHCGACGVACAQGEVCAMGRCALECGPGLALCSGASGGADGGGVRLCANTRTDRLHCGACGNVCAAGELCNDGVCSLTCVAGQTPCRGACRDLRSDSANCGACGMVCASSEVCRDGACALSCASGQSPCSGTCRDLQSDNANCGACGMACPAGTACTAGRCDTTCAMGLRACSGSCRNLDADPAHCGACGFMCPTPTAARSFCAAGRCGYTCTTGVGDCDGDASNGCESDLSAVTSCGACGVRCAFANATPACTTGRCALGACTTGFLDCNMAPADGCEVDGRTDNSNCGACGTRCATGEVCSMGRCERVCATGLTACRDRCADLATDVSNCGACGTVCPARANATARCAGRSCSSVCNEGFADCDGDAMNGCEVNTRTDNNHCGACMRRCTMGTCSSGSCTRIVFVTSTMHSGDLGGIDGADAICQMRATAAGIPGTFRAWVASAAGSPATRFTRSTAPYALVNGTVVANNWDDLTDGTLARPIDRTERDTPAPTGNTSCAGSGNRTAWSAVANNGTWSGGTACGGFTSTSGGGLWGQIDSTGSWTSWCSGGLCSWLSPLYCFQQ